MLNLCQTNKELSKQWMNHLFKKYMPHIEKIEVERPLISIMGFTPLPFFFQTDYLTELDKVNKEYQNYYFMGNPGDRIMFANRRVPSYSNDAIPFTFPYKKKNTSKLLQSNIFYFEIELLKNNHREPWDKECLSIGYGTEKTIYKNQVGWSPTSWGFHSDDGCYMNCNKSQIYTSPWEKGDIIGVALKYLGNYNYSIFLTKNGVIAGEEKIFSTLDNLYPMIGFDVSFPIKLNFGEEEFCFELENYINSNEIINNKKTFLLCNQNISSYSYTPSSIILVPKKINSKINIINKTSIYDLPKDLINKNLGESNTNNFFNNFLQNLTKSIPNNNEQNNLLDISGTLLNISNLVDISSVMTSDLSNNSLINVNYDMSNNYNYSNWYLSGKNYFPFLINPNTNNIFSNPFVLVQNSGYPPLNINYQQQNENQSIEHNSNILPSFIESLISELSTLESEYNSDETDISNNFETTDNQNTDDEN